MSTRKMASGCICAHCAGVVYPSENGRPFAIPARLDRSREFTFPSQKKLNITNIRKKIKAANSYKGGPVREKYLLRVEIIPRTQVGIGNFFASQKKNGKPVR